LWIISQLHCGDFVAKRISIYRNLHLATLTSAQVVLQNLSLAYSSVLFHQLIRLLLTPATALFSFLIYKATMSRATIIPLILSCGGVGMVFYFDFHAAPDKAVGTSPKGVIFAFAGILTSALYTSLIGGYQKKLQINSMQLLLNQAPISAGLLMCLAPVVDTPPTATTLSPSVCVAIIGVSE
jgi:solute carrier family 35 protein E3